ncbi:MAG: hypothetical protein WC121_09915 [Candidatus Kapaibacterium sp.]
MKKTLYIFLTLILPSTILISQQGLVNSSTGTINNQGKIIIKKNSLSNDVGGKIENSVNARIEIEEQAGMTSDGFINNQGTIESFGHIARISQLSIDGTVIIDNNKEVRNVPQISYNNILLKGKGTKELRTNGAILESRNYFFSGDSASIIWNKNSTGIEIHSLNETEHNGNINPAFTYGKYILIGTAAQNISGNGRFANLELDNSTGADVVNKTGNTPNGFTVARELRLTSGELRNSIDANFKMADSSTIVRNFGGSLSNEPILEGRLDVNYIGSGQMLTGGEIPTSVDPLQELLVENGGGIILSKDATANKRILVGDNIKAYEVDGADQITSEHTLTYTANNDPEFNGDTEIEGKFKRTNLSYDGTNNLFNNRTTFASFSDPSNPDGISTLTFDVKPGRRWSINPRLGDKKVQRTYAFFAQNDQGDDLASAQALNVGYSWKHDAADQGNIKNHETPAELMVQIEQLVLQKWNSTANVWENNQTSTIPNQDGAWLTAQAVLNSFGDHAVGLSAEDYLYLLAKVLMEGPYRGTEMGTELVEKGLVPKSPPDMYPYNLDPNKDLHVVDQLPPDVVDWIVLEFRDKAFEPNNRHFRTCFLRKDGKIVDKDGSSPVRLSRLSTNNLDTTGGYYWIAIRHRSHLTIMSKDSLYIGPADNAIEYDFSNPILLMGGSARPVGFTETGRVQYGMTAGNYPNPATTVQELMLGANGIDEINFDDYNKSWESFNLINRYLNEDFNMDGIITTRDYNKSWNNRDQISPIK